MTGEAKRVCIIGAGPAGLFAAYHLSRFVRNTTITILESGPKSRNGSSNLPNRDIRCPVTIDGPGGAGVFADKLYFDPAGGWLEDESKLDARAYMALVAEIFEKFTGYADWGSGANPANNLQISGLVYKPYPNIISATLREYLRFVGKLMTELRTRGVKIRFSHEVRSIRLLPDSTFALGLKGGQRLDCDIVLLATGRGSTTWLERQARRLGLKFAPADALLGVRIETLTSRVSGLRALNLDPKIRTSDRR